jgi:hypothetical protein
MSYAKAARDIADLLESGVVLNEVLFAWLAERLAGLCEDDKPAFDRRRFEEILRALIWPEDFSTNVHNELGADK